MPTETGISPAAAAQRGTQRRRGEHGVEAATAASASSSARRARASTIRETAAVWSNRSGGPTALKAGRVVAAERDEQPGRRRRALHVGLPERAAHPQQLGLHLVHRPPAREPGGAEQQQAAPDRGRHRAAV